MQNRTTPPKYTLLSQGRGHLQDKPSPGLLLTREPRPLLLVKAARGLAAHTAQATPALCHREVRKPQTLLGPSLSAGGAPGVLCARDTSLQ